MILPNGTAGPIHCLRNWGIDHRPKQRWTKTESNRRTLTLIPKSRQQCRPRTGFQVGTYLYTIAKVLGEDMSRGGGRRCAWRQRRLEGVTRGPKKGERGADGREWSGPRGNIDARGRAVILHRPADSDPRRTADLTCQASKSGKCVSFFSLQC